MNTITSSQLEHTHAYQPTQVASGNQGIRDLLRDTALLVTTLSAGGTCDDPQAFRTQCRELVDQFSRALEQRGFSPDIQEEALIAQCGLLDETALRYLPMEARTEWEQHPLQVENFHLHEAGERVFENLEGRLRESSSSLALLECYSAILGMGFMGRYAREGEAKRLSLMATLNNRLQNLRPDTNTIFMIEHKGRFFKNRFHRLSPWALVGITLVVAVTTWFLWSAVLDNQLARLVDAKVTRP